MVPGRLFQGGTMSRFAGEKFFRRIVESVSVFCRLPTDSFLIFLFRYAILSVDEYEWEDRVPRSFYMEIREKSPKEKKKQRRNAWVWTRNTLPGLPGNNLNGQ